jgi:MFS family permease
MIGMGFISNWIQLLGLRVVLGALEAGFFPICVYLLSTWYIRCRRTPIHLSELEIFCRLSS